MAALSSSPVQPRPWLVSSAALLAHLVLLGIFYGPTRRLGLMSDAWGIIDVVQGRFRDVLAAPVGYHFIPVSNLLVYAGHAAFGLRPLPWQISNLLMFLLVSHLVFQLGRRLLPAWLAFLASVLFMTNGAFHEVTYWSVVGNIHSLAVAFYLMGMILLVDISRGRAGASRSWALALLVTLATFTYEGMISLVPVAAAILFLRCEPAPSWREWARNAWRQAVLPLLPCAVPVGLALAAKLRYSRELEGATSFAVDPTRLYFLARGAASIFTLRAAHDSLHRLVVLGSSNPALVTWFAVGWLVVGFCVLVVAIVRFRRSVPTLLLTWLAIHLALIGVSITMVSRHTYLPAVPAALLTAWALGAVGERASRLFTSEPRRAASLAMSLPTLGALAMVAWAQRDLRTANEAWGRASQVNQSAASLVAQLVPMRRPPVTVCYVNMPGMIAVDGIGAYAFGNGLTQIAHFLGGSHVGGVELAHLHRSAPAGLFASKSRPVSLVEIERWSLSDDRVVIAFDPLTEGVRALTPTTWRRPDRYLRETLPQLPWQPGAWWWFAVPAHTSIDLPLHAPSPSWLSLRYLHQGDTRFRVSAGAGREPMMEIGPRTGTPAWTVSTAEVPPHVGEDPVLHVDALAETWIAHVWSFRPQARYDASRAPFLPWLDGFPPFLIVSDALELPMDTTRCSPCRLVVEYASEHSRDARISVDGGAERTLHQSSADWVRWELPLAAGAADVARVRLTPSAAHAFRLKSLHVERVAERVLDNP